MYIRIPVSDNPRLGESRDLSLSILFLKWLAAIRSSLRASSLRLVLLCNAGNLSEVQGLDACNPIFDSCVIAHHFQSGFSLTTTSLRPPTWLIGPFSRCTVAMTTQAALIADTIVGMKRALRRERDGTLPLGRCSLQFFR